MLVVIGSGVDDSDRILQVALAIDTEPDIDIHGVMLVREIPGNDAAALAITGMGDVVQRSLANQAALQRSAIAKIRARFEKACEDQGIEHRWLPVTQSISDTDAFWYDMVIAGRHIRPSSERDEQIAAVTIRPHACPLISVSESGASRPTRTLAALSGSPASIRALKTYVWCQPWPGSELSLLHVADDDDPHRGEGLLEHAADYCRDHGVSLARTATIEGEPASTITATAEDWGAEAIVMGDSGAGFLSFHELGRTLRTVMGSAPQTIFVAA